MKKFFASLALVLCAAGALAQVPPGANELHRVTTILCDTPAQLAEYISRVDVTRRGPDFEILRQINAANPPADPATSAFACGVGTFMLIPGEHGATVTDATGKDWVFVHVLVIGDLNTETHTMVSLPKPFLAWGAEVADSSKGTSL